MTLIKAAESGNLDMVRNLIKDGGVNVNDINEVSNSRLYISYKDDS